MPGRPSILVVDDTPLLARHLVDLVSGVWGWHAEVAKNAGEALDRCRGTRFSAVLMDVSSVGGDLDAFLKALAGPPLVPAIALVGPDAPGRQTLDRHLHPRGALRGILDKPFAQEDLRLNLHELLHRGLPPSPAPERPPVAPATIAPPGTVPATPAPPPPAIEIPAAANPLTFYEKLRAIPEVSGFALYEHDGTPSSEHGSVPTETAQLVNFAADVADGEGREAVDLLLELRLHLRSGRWLCLVGEDRRLVLAATPGADLGTISRQVHAAS